MASAALLSVAAGLICLAVVSQAIAGETSPPVAPVPVAATVKGTDVFPAVTLAGGYDNAQINGIRVEDATAASPRVIIAGTVPVGGVPEKTRDRHRFIHWNFRLSNCADRTVRFELYIDSGNPQIFAQIVPVVRYPDGTVELMRGIELKSYGQAKGKWMETLGAFFSHRFRADLAQISYCLPFTNDMAADLASQLKADKNTTVIDLGKTPLFNLPTWQFIVTDPAVPDKDKRGIWLHSCEDPWEFPGTFNLVGFVRFATGNDPLAVEFRKRFVLSVIPFVNPDAVHRGDTNFYLDPNGRDIINGALSWKRVDIVPHELIKGAMRKWKSDGRSLDFMTSMHSAVCAQANMRIDWAYDAKIAQRFKEEIFEKKYIPWAASTGVARGADMSATLGASLAAQLWPDRLIFAMQHLENLVWYYDKEVGIRRCQQPEDNFIQGELEARSLCEFYDVKVPLNQIPPFLMCGLVDQYWAAASTPMNYTVLYRDTEGRAAQFVRLHIGNKTIEMKAISGTDPVKGIVYSATEPLAEGKNDYSFTTSNGAIEIHYPRNGTFVGAYTVKR